MQPTPHNQQSAETPTLDRIGLQVSSHLERETEAICETITTLAAMRSALAKNDTKGLKEALEKQRQHADASRELARCRDAIKLEIAAALNVDLDSATISELAGQVSDSTREAILLRRRKLLQLHREADAINHGNASLAAQSLALLRYCFVPDGQADTSTRYSESGEIETREIRNTMEARA